MSGNDKPRLREMNNETSQKKTNLDTAKEGFSDHSDGTTQTPEAQTREFLNQLMHKS